MKALIVDDERLARSELRRLLLAHPEVDVIAEAINGDDALAKIETFSPELMFLDVQMPGKTGFEVLAHLTHPPSVIFTTAYDQFALRAFEVNALDYLLKPIEPDRLALALSRLQLSQESTAGPSDGLGQPEPITTSDADPMPILEASDRILVKDGSRCWFVTLSEVSLFESEGNYVRLFFKKERPLVYRSLAYLEDRLSPKTFFRAGRKHIINMDHIDEVVPLAGGGLLIQVHGLRLEMSRRQAQKFRDTMAL